jgi:predicted transposase/invertase (TIGR01784 family)
MFSLSELKQTRFYQDAFTEGKEEGKEEGREQGARLEKLKTAPLLLRLGLSVEQTAQELRLSVEEVREAAQ